MHWIELIIGFFFGSFLGITIMAILVVAGRAEENMEKYFVSFTDFNEIVKDIGEDHVKGFQI